MPGLPACFLAVRRPFPQKCQGKRGKRRPTEKRSGKNRPVRGKYFVFRQAKARVLRYHFAPPEADIFCVFRYFYLIRKEIPCLPAEIMICRPAVFGRHSPAPFSGLVCSVSGTGSFPLSVKNERWPDALFPIRLKMDSTLPWKRFCISFVCDLRNRQLMMGQEDRPDFAGMQRVLYPFSFLR